MADKKEVAKTPTITNRKAQHLYFIEDRFEVGVMLVGSEIKSIRAGKCSFNEAWVEVSKDKNELWLVGAHIDEYFFAKRFGHEPQRKRKLLAHVSEIQKMRKATELKGLTLIPLKLYFKKRYAKIEVGLCRGKDQRDKRQDIIARDEKLAIARIVKASGRR
ncbi:MULTISPECIES: SsrA-binding protein SmpB [Hallerella]|nr:MULTISPECIES: SsrA-binding protein SmpB [Hallerella]MCI6872955.1 SsrA-binding protein SmpB [Hallerella sp.]MDY5028099.1 SsrA-binding protein SmpB [Hallerella succinigenes]